MLKLIKRVLPLVVILSAISIYGAFAQDASSEQIPASEAASVGTAFHYQGILMDSDKPASGKYDFQFSLFDAASAGKQIGKTITKAGISVTDSVFTTSLDFGIAAFDGAERHLAIAVRNAGSGSYTPLAGRQALLPVPYAMNADLANAVGIAGRSPSVTVASNGRVGILTENPTTNLTVGEAGPASNVTIRAGLNEEGTDPREMVIGVSGDAVNIRSTNEHPMHFWANGKRHMTLTTEGHLGIGTTTPSTDLGIQAGAECCAEILMASNSSDTFLFLGTRKDYTVINTLSDDPMLLSVNGAERMRIAPDGNVGIGTPRPKAKLDINGTSRSKVVEITGGSDLAEPFAFADKELLEPGMVVAIDPKHPGQLRIADSAYDQTVAGIVSGAGGINPGLVLQQEGSVADGDVPVALTGRVYVLADAQYGAIQPGDLLTTSNTFGHAMRVGDYGEAQGAILGKAMQPLDEGTGLVLVLVSLQ